jgi:hypothetical protein
VHSSAVNVQISTPYAKMGKLYVNIRLNVTLLTFMKTINNVAGTLMRGWKQTNKQSNKLVQNREEAESHRGYTKYEAK